MIFFAPLTGCNAVKCENTDECIMGNFEPQNDTQNQYGDPDNYAQDTVWVSVVIEDLYEKGIGSKLSVIQN